MNAIYTSYIVRKYFYFYFKYAPNYTYSISKPFEKPSGQTHRIDVEPLVSIKHRFLYLGVSTPFILRRYHETCRGRAITPIFMAAALKRACFGDAPPGDRESPKNVYACRVYCREIRAYNTISTCVRSSSSSSHTTCCMRCRPSTVSYGITGW